jgi:C1A family cysteine protease
MRARLIQWYGYRRDSKDPRDLLFKPRRRAVLPSKVDLRTHCCPIMDQGQLGSCTAHGITAALRYLHLKAGKADFPMSRLQLYYDERKLEGTVSEDAGAEIRDGIKCAVHLGVAHESLWSYKISKFRTQPAATVYKDALKYQALVYRRVDVNADALKQALATGYPVVIGINVYDAFESDEVASTGMVPQPSASDAPIGGHCMLVVGYGQKTGRFTVQNSWGADWGDNGFCYLPYKYLGSPAFGSDYWVITSDE